MIEKSRACHDTNESFSLMFKIYMNISGSKRRAEGRRRRRIVMGKEGRMGRETRRECADGEGRKGIRFLLTFNLNTDKVAYTGVRGVYCHCLVTSGQTQIC